VKFKLHSFSTLALDGGVWLASLSGRFISGKEPPAPIGQKVVWAPESVWTCRQKDCPQPNPGRLDRTQSRWAMVARAYVLWRGI